MYSNCKLFYQHDEMQTLYRDRVLNNLEKKHSIQRRLGALILWTSLQAIGGATIKDRIQTALQTCRILYDDLIGCVGVKIIVSRINE